MDLMLEGKTAVITGCSKGIGYAVAEGLAKEGVDLFILARKEKDLKEAAQKLEKENIKCVDIKADVTKLEDLENAVSIIKEHTDTVDILINNAGTGSKEDIMDASDEKWQYYWDLHVMAAVRLSRMIVPMMKKNENEGVILNTSSICAKQPLDYEPIYNTTKAALTMLSKCLANELIDDNIRVNSVNPGLILTSDWKSTAKKLTEGKDITLDDYFRDIAEDKTPIGRFADPEEVANFYVFLSSPLASYMTGSSYYVDGGWLNTTI